MRAGRDRRLLVIDFGHAIAEGEPQRVIKERAVQEVYMGAAKASASASYQ